MKSEKTEVSNQPIVNMCNCDCRLTDSYTKNIDQVRVQGSGEISNMDLLTTKKEDRSGEDHPVTKSNMWNINRNSSSSRMISLKDTTTNQSHRWRRSSESVTVDSSKFSTKQSDQKRRRSSHKGSWSPSSSSDSIQNKPVPHFRDRLIITIPCEIVNWQRSRYVVKNKSCGRIHRPQVMMRKVKIGCREFKPMISNCDKFAISFKFKFGQTRALRPPFIWICLSVPPAGDQFWT